MRIDDRKSFRILQALEKLKKKVRNKSSPAYYMRSPLCLNILNLFMNWDMNRFMHETFSEQVGVHENPEVHRIVSVWAFYA